MDRFLSAAGRDWPAPAKINLFLHVIGRRADGYHLLQTAFQFLDLHDTLHFTPREDGRVCRRGGLACVPQDQDLVVRAAQRLRQASGCRAGVDIELHKRIPEGGGLGGGSSDAATTLVALNALWALGLEPPALQAIGLELGADVPVFVHGHAAWAEGVGEVLAPIEPAERWALLVHPQCHVSTAEVFQDAELTRATPAITMRDFLAGTGHNDCDPVVRRRYRPVAEALDWLSEHATARITGTGACVFALFESRAAAAHIAARLPERWRGFVVRTVNRSSLLERLSRWRRTQEHD